MPIGKQKLLPSLSFTLYFSEIRSYCRLETSTNLQIISQQAHPGKVPNTGNNKIQDSSISNRSNEQHPTTTTTTNNANGISSKPKIVTSIPTMQKPTPTPPPLKKMGKRSKDIEEYNKSTKPYMARSKASIAGGSVNPSKKRSKYSSASAKPEDKKGHKIAFSNQDMIKFYIPHEASYRISSENVFNVMYGLNIFDYADALWVETAPSSEASLPFSMFEYDVYDDSEQRIIICVPEFKNLEDMSSSHNPVLEGNSDNMHKKENNYFEEIPFEYNCQTVVGKPVCKISYHSEANHIKTKCYQSAVRLMHLDVFMKDRHVGTIVQQNNLIMVKDSTNNFIMEVSQVPITIGGFCISRDKAFQSEVNIVKEDSKQFFGIMGRNGKRQRRTVHGPALGFYFNVMEKPIPNAALSFYKMFALAILVGLTTSYTEMG
ncbi:unnamed protein product [Allacma fusca]|uniref:Uncharacterized protein n=1 Tax=Allacma fusca TaxID=39272 RepID=A0A8J2LGE9_9HEXA|nr:unnamed protein product [Allacma fusca]